MAPSNIPTLEELEARLAKLKGIPPSTEELEARLAKLQDRPYQPSKEPIDEVGKLMEQMTSELSLEQKSKNFSNQKDQVLRDRLDKLKESSPTKTLPKLSIITDSIKAQRDMASRVAKQTKEPEVRRPVAELVINLDELSKITADISPKLKKQEDKVFDMIAGALTKIYEGIKKIATPAVNILKKIGSTFIDSIKSLSKNSPNKGMEESKAGFSEKSSNKQMEESKASLKDLYKSYADLKGVDEKVKKEFLKNHYAQIDNIKTPQEMFLETAKITKSIAIAGAKKVQQISHKISYTNDLQHNGSLTPPATPNVNRNSTKRGAGR
ncbi:MAG TPA: hypothetical protein LFW21_04880 [Rickettsia endosymbiont of Pyrocoelia pectoralis]|nr:hypothetical protein [Rickettsia endosymbiont of Pyrocoelia pectoralis]